MLSPFDPEFSNSLPKGNLYNKLKYEDVGSWDTIDLGLSVCWFIWDSLKIVFQYLNSWKYPSNKPVSGAIWLLLPVPPKYPCKTVFPELNKYSFQALL